MDALLFCNLALQAAQALEECFIPELIKICCNFSVPIIYLQNSNKCKHFLVCRINDEWNWKENTVSSCKRKEIFFVEA